MSGSAQWWWMRSADKTTNNIYRCIKADGSTYYPTSSNLYGVSPAFRIG